jgi:hypothetical protein
MKTIMCIRQNNLWIPPEPAAGKADSGELLPLANISKMRKGSQRATNSQGRAARITLYNSTAAGVAEKQPAGVQ